MTENEAIEAMQFDFKIGGEIHSQVLRDAADVAIQALETVQKYKDLESELSKRNLTIDHIREYIQFEDECVEMGFTFDSLLEARGKQIKKKPVVEENEMFHTKYYRCPICGGNLKICDFLFNYCRMCGQKIDWKGIKNE
jgi:hypothetical protein